MGGNEYIRSLSLLERGIQSLPLKQHYEKNVKPARFTLALVSHSFLLAWLKKWCEGQVKILSRN